MRRFVRHRLAVIGAFAIVAIAATAFLLPAIVAVDPRLANLATVRQAPSLGHLLGTDQSGRDVLSRVVFGTQTSLIVGFGAVSVYIILGAALGLIAGFFGGAVDYVIMRGTETLLSIPTLLLIIAFVAIVGPGLGSVIAVIGLLGWPATARLVRAQVLTLREAEFITAARVLGVRDRQILTAHLLPNLLGLITVVFTLGVANAILLEASISFLGLGVQPPTPSLGAMINEARSPRVLFDLPWLWIPPGLAIAMTVLAVNFVGDGLRDALDPRAVDR